MKTCEVCGKTKDVHYRHRYNMILCRQHMYEKEINDEDKAVKIKKCEICGAEKNAKYRTKHGKILCAKHYQQFDKYGGVHEKIKETDIVRVCDVCQLESIKVTIDSKSGKSVCPRHKRQLYLHGRITDIRSSLKNDIIYHPNHAEVVLYGKDRKEKARAIIDIEDVSRVSNRYFYLSAGRPRTADIESSTPIYLHRLITNCPDDMVVHHTNGDLLDNRKSNLLVLSRTEKKLLDNSANKKDNFIGVYFHEDNQKWAASISELRRVKHLGFFEDIEEAVISRLKAEKKYYGEFAPQKHLFGEYGII